MSIDPQYDCRHFLGDRPCALGERCRCAHCSPMGTRVLIIKLAALGDVVRTACLLPTLHRAFDPVHVTWVSTRSGIEALRDHPDVDCLVEFNSEGTLLLTQQEFDLVLSLDKEPAPAALCNAVRSADKRGMGLSRFGTVGPVNEAANEYFLLGLDDEAKFHRNTKSYPQLIHEAVGLPYTREPYRLHFSEPDGEHARALFAPWRALSDGAVIGVNTGGGKVFANKAPSPPRWVEICRLLLQRGHTVVLLGGEGELATNEWIARQFDRGVYNAGNGHSVPQFVAIVDQCDAVVTGDTLALHLAVARSVPVVALFGPTCEQEIDLFGRGRKVLTPLDCAPCYRRSCPRTPSCMDAIAPSDVADTLDRVLSECGVREPRT